jgi:hypothetical protein
MKVLRCSRGGSEWNVANLGWADYAKGPIEIAELPGDHTSIMGEPIVALVAAYIDKWLAEAAAGAGFPEEGGSIREVGPDAGAPGSTGPDRPSEALR